MVLDLSTLVLLFSGKEDARSSVGRSGPLELEAEGGQRALLALLVLGILWHTGGTDGWRREVGENIAPPSACRGGGRAQGGAGLTQSNSQGGAELEPELVLQVVSKIEGLEGLGSLS